MCVYLIAECNLLILELCIKQTVQKCVLAARNGYAKLKVLSAFPLQM